MQRWEFKQELKKQFPVFYERTLRIMAGMFEGEVCYENDDDFAEMFMGSVLPDSDNKRHKFILGCDCFKQRIYEINDGITDSMEDRVSNQYVFNFIKRNEDALLFMML